MAFDAYVKIDTIPGESPDEKHKDWIPILSYSHGLSQPGAGARHTTNRTVGRVDHQTFNIVKRLDKASPKLAVACCNGEHIKEVRFSLNRATKDKQKIYEIVMSDVLITSYTPSGGHGGDDLPTETVALSYDKIEWIYTETDHSTGKPKGDVKAKWDLLANKGG